MKAIRAMLWILVIALGLGITVLSLSQTASAQTDKAKNEKEQDDDDKDDDENLSADDKSRAKITLAEARVIALKRISGTVVEEELEKEKGRLQYAFDIKDGNGKVWDVEIDAVSGEILQAAEDDEDGDNDRSSLKKTKNSVYRAANTVKNVTVRMVGKLF